MIKCPYCGASRLQNTGGENGNPFDRRPEKTICLDCGRTISESEPQKGIAMPDLSAAIRMMDELENAQKMKSIVVEMTARGAGVTREEKAVIPYEDGEYSLHKYPYPLSRYDGILIRGDAVQLDGEIYELTNNVQEIVKHYTAYAPDKHPEQETITIRIYTNTK